MLRSSGTVSLGGAGRLRRDLPAEEARPAHVALGVHAAEDVTVELLEVEHAQELGDVAGLGFAPLDRSRRVVHGGNRRPQHAALPATTSLTRRDSSRCSTSAARRARVAVEEPERRSAGSRCTRPASPASPPGRTKCVTPNVYQTHDVGVDERPVGRGPRGAARRRRRAGSGTRPRRGARRARTA